jgi:hypothetical protein
VGPGVRRALGETVLRRRSYAAAGSISGNFSSAWRPMRNSLAMTKHWIWQAGRL